MTPDPTPAEVEAIAAEIRHESMVAMLDDPPRSYRGAGARREPKAVKCHCAVPCDGVADD